MKLSHEPVNSSTAFADPVAAPDDEIGQCLKLIRKLRWIGMEDEADRLQQSLTGVAPHERGAVLDDPRNTD